jgi:hypothetical protein
VNFQASCVDSIPSRLCCIQPNGEKEIAEVQLLITPDAMEYFFRSLRITHDNVLCPEILKPRGIFSPVALDLNESRQNLTIFSLLRQPLDSWGHRIARSLHNKRLLLMTGIILTSDLQSFWHSLHNCVTSCRRLDSERICVRVKKYRNRPEHLGFSWQRIMTNFV